MSNQPRAAQNGDDMDHRSKWSSPPNVTHWTFFVMGLAVGALQTWLALRG